MFSMLVLCLYICYVMISLIWNYVRAWGSSFESLFLFIILLLYQLYLFTWISFMYIQLMFLVFNKNHIFVCFNCYDWNLFLIWILLLNWDYVDHVYSDSFQVCLSRFFEIQFCFHLEMLYVWVLCYRYW